MIALLAVEAKKIQRFKASLVAGSWPENPEPLVRDDEGDYVKYADALRLKIALETVIDALDLAKNALIDS